PPDGSREATPTYVHSSAHRRRAQLDTAPQAQPPQPGRSTRPSLTAQASRCSTTSPRASNRRSEMPASVTSSPLSRAKVHHSTAARSPSTSGSPNQGSAHSVSASARSTYSRGGSCERNGWERKRRQSTA